MEFRHTRESSHGILILDGIDEIDNCIDPVKNQLSLFSPTSPFDCSKISAPLWRPVLIIILIYSGW